MSSLQPLRSNRVVAFTEKIRISYKGGGEGWRQNNNNKWYIHTLHRNATRVRGESPPPYFSAFINISSYILRVVSPYGHISGCLPELLRVTAAIVQVNDCTVVSHRQLSILYICSEPFARLDPFTRKTIEYMGQAQLFDKLSSEWDRGSSAR